MPEGTVMGNKSKLTSEKFLETAKNFRENAQLVSSTEYNESHCEIVEAGMNSITTFYQSNNIDEKRALLFCMERYIDPYYKSELPHLENTIKWLEQEFYQTRNNQIKEDIFELLQYADVDLSGYAVDDNGKFISKRWWQFWK